MHSLDPVPALIVRRMSPIVVVPPSANVTKVGAGGCQPRPGAPDQGGGQPGGDDKIKCVDSTSGAPTNPIITVIDTAGTQNAIPPPNLSS